MASRKARRTAHNGVGGRQIGIDAALHEVPDGTPMPGHAFSPQDNRFMLRSIVRTATALLRVTTLAVALVAQGQAHGQRRWTEGPAATGCRAGPGGERALDRESARQPLQHSKRVVVADLKGPAEITMIHFALPQSEVGAPLQRLNRDLLLMMTWDGEATPSVLCRWSISFAIPRVCARRCTPNWSTSGGGSMPISPCRFASRPASNWSMRPGYARRGALANHAVL